MTGEGVDEGGQEGVVGEIWFEVPREDVSKGCKGVISGAEEIDGLVAGNMWWVAESFSKAVTKI